MKYILSILLSVYIHKFGYMLRMEVPEYTRSKFKKLLCQEYYDKKNSNWDTFNPLAVRTYIHSSNNKVTVIKQPKGKITKSKIY